MKTQPGKLLRRCGILFAVLLIAGLGVVVYCLIRVSCPFIEDITIGSTTFEQVIFDGKAYLRVQGEGGSPIGQIEEIAYELDPNNRTVKIYRYVMLWNPLSRVSSHRRWPLIIDLTSLPEGEYRVECLDRGKYQEVVRFIKPAAESK